MSSYLALLQADYPVVIMALTLMFGLIFGSFLNVVIYRLPVILEQDWRNQANELLGLKTSAPSEPFNLIFPGSRCPGCNHEIRPWENIPILSYLYLRGKCAHCGMSISARYPAIEFLTGLLTCVVIYHFGLTWMGLAACVLTWSLIPLAMIDYDHQLLPDNITLPLLWVGLLVNYFDLIVDFREAFIGAIVGYLVLWIVFHVFRFVTGKEGMGYGDFKLLAMLGAWMGWQSLPAIIILSSFTGALLGGLLIAFGRDRANPIPFGPFLAIAGWITLLWGDELTATWLRFVA